MKISIIIASRLQPLPGGEPGQLYLHRSIASVQRQTFPGQVELEIVVGLDPGIEFPSTVANVVVAHGEKPRQACALNAAVAASSGELLAFLEDDDFWRPKRLGYGLNYLGQFDLVTSNQREVDLQGKFVSINDYPTPSGWLLSRATFDRVGPFDPAFRCVDSDFLGRVNRLRLRRLHLTEREAPERPWLKNVSRVSAIGRTGEPEPLVVRTVNPRGAASSLMQGPGQREHQEECRRMREMYGVIPW